MTLSPYLASNRFGLGSSADEMAQITRNPEYWLREQFDSDIALSGNFKSAEKISQELSALRQKKSDNKIIRKAGLSLFKSEMQARFEHAIQTQAPFLERLVNFWSNHFTISVAGRPNVAGFAGAFEREVIRPNILGKFSDMLIASCQHPAMLLYLDNAQSIGPNSKAGQRRGKGLNENLAREILELHTLGVNGGYSQDDVLALAKIITGWTITPPHVGGGGFRYVDFLHEPGDHVLLARRYDQKGVRQGLQALRDLASHDSTARFIATKMAQHFVSDDPPESAIRRLERTFLNSGGDLRELSRDLIKMNEVRSQKLAKVKSPYDFIVSSYRLLERVPKAREFRKVSQSLKLMEQVPFTAPSPAGWKDTAQNWISPNSTMNRVEWCHAFSQIAFSNDMDPKKIAKASLGDALSQQTLFWIERAPSAKDGLALLLASPEWQRR